MFPSTLFKHICCPKSDSCPDGSMCWFTHESTLSSLIDLSAYKYTPYVEPVSDTQEVQHKSPAVTPLPSVDTSTETLQTNNQKIEILPPKVSTDTSSRSVTSTSSKPKSKMEIMKEQMRSRRLQTQSNTPHSSSKPPERPVVHFDAANDLKIPLNIRNWALNQLIDVKTRVFPSPQSLPPLVLQRTYDDCVQLEKTWAEKFRHAPTGYKAYVATQLAYIKSSI
ncbi:hypothetical protein P9112_006857 [Eukaryota sp. TZLM1-RC]